MKEKVDEFMQRLNKSGEPTYPFIKDFKISKSGYIIGWNGLSVGIRESLLMNLGFFKDIRVDNCGVILSASQGAERDEAYVVITEEGKSFVLQVLGTVLLKGVPLDIYRAMQEAKRIKTVIAD